VAHVKSPVIGNENKKGKAESTVDTIAARGFWYIGVIPISIRFNPRLIYVGAYGYSQHGYVPVTIVDRGVGIDLFGTICAALYERTQTQRGQKIDVPMFETMTHMVMSDHCFGKTFDLEQGQYGYKRPLSNARKPYPKKLTGLGRQLPSSRQIRFWLKCSITGFQHPLQK